MTAEILDPPMADEKPKTLSVKLHMDVIEAARVVAALENVSMTDLLSNILRPILAKREDEVLVKRAKARKKGETKG
jgi:hypothetical protein